MWSCIPYIELCEVSPCVPSADSGPGFAISLGYLPLCVHLLSAVAVAFAVSRHSGLQRE